MAIEEVVAGQVFTGRRTSLRAGAASQVSSRSGTASEGEDAGRRPEGSASVGHTFKIGVRAKARRQVRFPSASATERDAWPAALHGERVRRTREGLGWSPTDRVYHTSVSGFHRPAAGQVF